MVLRSGQTLDAAKVHVLDDAVEVVLHRGGGVATVRLAFDQLEPRALLALLERHLPPGGAAAAGQAHLDLAARALEYGLFDTAARHFHQSAVLDESLTPARDDGLVAVRARRTQHAISVLEQELRADAPARVLDQADALAAGVLSDTQRLRVAALAGLAERMIARAQAASPAPQPASAPSEENPIFAEVTKGHEARDAAADPDLRPAQAIRHLETAARAFQAARKIVNGLAEPPAEALQAAADLRDLLVWTYLDLADLYRQQGRFDRARALVRAVFILDPESGAAREMRSLIEADLHAAYGAGDGAYCAPLVAYRSYAAPFHGIARGRAIGWLGHSGFGFRAWGHYRSGHGSGFVRRMTGVRRSRR